MVCVTLGHLLKDETSCQAFSPVILAAVWEVAIAQTTLEKALKIPKLPIGQEPLSSTLLGEINKLLLLFMPLFIIDALLQQLGLYPN